MRFQCQLHNKIKILPQDEANLKNGDISKDEVFTVVRMTAPTARRDNPQE
jgi:hypothetical protein